MARKGRKRKQNVERYPCQKPRVPQDDARNVVRWTRLKDTLGKQMDDPGFGTELGRLFWQGKIFAYQKEAGDRLAQIVTDHRQFGLVVGDQVLSLPTLKPCRLEPAIPGERHVDAEEAGKIQDRYDHLFAGVIDSGRDGVAMWKVLVRLCVENEPLTYQELLLAKRGLDRAAVLLGLADYPALKGNYILDKYAS